MIICVSLQGVPSRVPPNSSLLFEVEVLRVCIFKILPNYKHPYIYIKTMISGDSYDNLDNSNDSNSNNDNNNNLTFK